MSLDVIKVGIYILLFLPGFIFVETCEFHLLRERKPQFEKSLEIILWSGLIWFVCIVAPSWWPFPDARSDATAWAERLLRDAGTKNPASDAGAGGATTQMTGIAASTASRFGVSVCAWAFVVANLWGIFRKISVVDAVIRYCTGRDWYPSVSYKFFSENINRGVVVSLEDRRYIGVLFSAPDRKEDNHIILTGIAEVPKPIDGASHGGSYLRAEPLPLVDSILIKIDEIKEIQSLNQAVLRKIEDAPAKGKWISRWFSKK